MSSRRRGDPKARLGCVNRGLLGVFGTRAQTPSSCRKPQQAFSRRILHLSTSEPPGVSARGAPASVIHRALAKWVGAAVRERPPLEPRHASSPHEFAPCGSVTVHAVLVPPGSRFGTEVNVAVAGENNVEARAAWLHAQRAPNGTTVRARIALTGVASIDTGNTFGTAANLVHAALGERMLGKRRLRPQGLEFASFLRCSGPSWRAPRWWLPEKRSSRPVISSAPLRQRSI